MKNPILYTAILIISGACLGFFGLVYWNLNTAISQTIAQEQQVASRLEAVEKFLSPDSAQ